MCVILYQCFPSFLLASCSLLQQSVCCVRILPRLCPFFVGGVVAAFACLAACLSTLKPHHDTRVHPCLRGWFESLTSQSLTEWGLCKCSELAMNEVRVGAEDPLVALPCLRGHTKPPKRAPDASSGFLSLRFTCVGKTPRSATSTFMMPRTRSKA